jgi:acetyl esterase/lipase
LLDRFDKDGNGKVERSEATGQLEQAFDRVDTNSDGVLGPQELVTLARMLQSRRQNDRPQTATAKVPPNVELRKDVAYREGHAKWKVDLMLPKQQSDSLRPGVVFIHGGGWRSGDKGGKQWRSMPLTYASKGYVCISINYRLSGDAPFPASIEDCKCAVRWFRANAKEFNLDPNRIGAYGNSAGAHLAAVIGLAGPNAKLEGDGPHQDQSSLVQAVCCSATPSDFTLFGSPERTASRLFPGMSGEKRDGMIRRCSPVTHVSAQAPPFLIFHGTADKVVPFRQGVALEKALKDAGASDVKFMKFDGAGHGVFGQKAKTTHPAMEAFFARTLQQRKDAAPKPTKKAPEQIFSGPQPGEKIKPFKVLHVKAEETKELEIAKVKKIGEPSKAGDIKNDNRTTLCFIHKLSNDDRILYGLGLVDFYLMKYKDVSSHFVLLSKERER